MQLTDMACKNAKPKAKPYKIFDGGGLYLEITPTGSKLWRLKYYYLGKEKRLSLGKYPLIRLSDAREDRDAAKRLLAKSIDPAQERQQQKRALARNAVNTFQAVAQEWFEMQQHAITPKHAQMTWRRLERHVFPFLGHRPIAEITPPELLECLRTIEKRGTLEMTKRIKQVCGQVFRYGIQTGKCERDAAADLKGALRPTPTVHFRTLEAKELPAFLKALERNEARLFERTRRAVWFSLYTFCRPGEIRQACWTEIDWDNAQWIIPGEKMKKRRDHIVPLSRQAIDVLRCQFQETGDLATAYVFPSQIRPRDPMSDGTVNLAIKRLGFGDRLVAHGFRALARTILREKLGYDSEVIEKQLAHLTRNPLGEAYDRTQFLDQRRNMMQAWAEYLEGCLVQTSTNHAASSSKRASR